MAVFNRAGAVLICGLALTLAIASQRALCSKAGFGELWEQKGEAYSTYGLLLVVMVMCAMGLCTVMILTTGHKVRHTSSSQGSTVVSRPEMSNRICCAAQW